MDQTAPLSIVADIGGTNTRIALARGTEILHDTITRYKNAGEPNFPPLLERFLAEHPDANPGACCVAAAGPVRDGRVEMTNLSWTFDKDDLAAATGASVIATLNDMQAQGHALPYLKPEALTNLRKGAEASPQAAMLIVGIGTGMNIAPVYHSASGTLVPPAEAGHPLLAVRNDDNLRLCQYIEKHHGFPSVEEVMSGRGVARIYEWLSSEAGEMQVLEPAEIMKRVEDGSDPIATETAHHFVQIMGSVCGNLALTLLPFGGIYLIGGVSRAFAPLLDKMGFEESFRDLGRFGDFVDQFGIWLVEDDFAALTGCASHLQDLLQRPH